MKRLLFLLVASVASLTGQEGPLALTNYHAPQNVQQLVFHNKKFYVEDDMAAREVKYYNLDSAAKKIKPEHILGLAKTNAAYFNIHQLSDDNYSLALKTRGDGGGIWAGLVGYYGTKIVAYGAYGAACFYDPELVLHATEISMAIETTAQAAGYAGTVSPLP